METICGYAGCKGHAEYELQQLVGNKQKLNVCVDHTPEWVKSGKGSQFYKVVKL